MKNQDFYIYIIGIIFPIVFQFFKNFKLFENKKVVFGFVIIFSIISGGIVSVIEGEFNNIGDFFQKGIIILGTSQIIYKLILKDFLNK